MTTHYKAECFGYPLMNKHTGKPCCGISVEGLINCVVANLPSNSTKKAIKQVLKDMDITTTDTTSRIDKHLRGMRS